MYWYLMISQILLDRYIADNSKHIINYAPVINLIMVGLIHMHYLYYHLVKNNIFMISTVPWTWLLPLLLSGRSRGFQGFYENPFWLQL